MFFFDSELLLLLLSSVYKFVQHSLRKIIQLLVIIFLNADEHSLSLHHRPLSRAVLTQVRKSSTVPGTCGSASLFGNDKQRFPLEQGQHSVCSYYLVLGTYYCGSRYVSPDCSPNFSAVLRVKVR
jgi:hypothetical protein